MQGIRVNYNDCEYIDYYILLLLLYMYIYIYIFYNL